MSTIRHSLVQRSGLPHVLVLAVGVLLAACGSTAPTSVESPSSQPVASSTLAPSVVPDRPTATPTTAPVQTPGATEAATPTSTASAHVVTTTHVVVAGDTLSGLAERTGLSIEQLLAANPQVTDRSLIRVGDRLTIPIGLLPIASATLVLPPLPVEIAGLGGCAQGAVAFNGGSAFPRGASRDWWDSTWIEDVVRVDVDHDGTTEIVAIIMCQPTQGSEGQVLVFRPRPDGGFETIGSVVRQAWPSAMDREAIWRVFGIDRGPGGQIRVHVGDYGSTLPGPYLIYGTYQTRTYGWNGRAFVQTAGSRTFLVPAGAVKLTITKSRASETTPGNGSGHTVVTVTIRNDGTTAVDDVSVFLGQDSPPVCLGPRGDEDHVCTVRHLERGATASVRFGGEGSVEVRIGDQKYVIEG